MISDSVKLSVAKVTPLFFMLNPSSPVNQIWGIKKSPTNLGSTLTSLTWKDSRILFKPEKLKLLNQTTCLTDEIILVVASNL